jgi:phage regulator Rha-like protein
MSATNGFLKDFLEMRKSLVPTQKIVGNPKPANPETQKRKEKFTKEQSTKDPTLATIIEDKPNKRVVIEYLQKHANSLTESKMA